MNININLKTSISITSALGGMSHGVVDFVIGSLHDLQTAAVYMGSADLEMSLYERSAMIEVVEQSQMQQLASMGSHFMGMLSIDASDAFYQSFRSKTTLGLEMGSLVAGGYGAVKGVIAFNRLARAPIQAAKFAKRLSSIERKGTFPAGSRRAPLEYAPFQTVRNEATVINKRTYSGHALDKMQNRGFMPSVIEETIKNGSPSVGKNPGTVAYYSNTNNVTVILNTKGRVITISYGAINQ
ncbi:DUF4258 domain-containing protein [Candidatus Rhabdochlamydia sp. T3358]|uniref:DUF4258 domain-containing protein n=1 Tax=Candidatus Rhabdochlamydia sp. T3358 TaxID=2099795 RepID=UPI0010B9A588|nr:DUF4258 domain-containing protein [Candidatus Rhabdochlamydia sp. T3358]VHO01010.1 hypothetical protein RHT_00276 [Candidatus Rhabdochlamydia sp. T3358]